MISPLVTHCRICYRRRSLQFNLKQRLRKVFPNFKKTPDGQRLPTQFERKIAITNWIKLTETECPPSWNKTVRERKNVAFRVIILALSVYYKRSFNGVVKIARGQTGRTSSPAWNLWKPFAFCPSQENSFRDFTLWNLNVDIAFI